MLFRTSVRQELRQVASATFVTLLTIVITTALIRILGEAANGKVDNDTVPALIVFTSMNYLSVILVLTTFMSVLMVVSRSFRDREMAVWWASGLPLLAWIRPVLSFAVPMVLLAALFSSVITPWARGKSEEVKQRFEKRSDVSKVSAGQFRESAGGDRIFFIEKDSPDRSVVENVFVANRADQRVSLIVSIGGRVETLTNGERFLVLNQGKRFDVTKNSTDFSALEFARYGIRLEPGFFLPPDITAQTADVRFLLADQSSSSLSELLWRFGLPLSGLFLALLAIPLSFVNPRAGRSLNLIFALLIYLVYSNFLSIAQAWVLQKKLSFLEAFVAPHGVALLIFFVLMFKRNRMSFGAGDLFMSFPRFCWRTIANLARRSDSQ
jgi:lipopolysaccharide export system permease protein